MVTALRGFFASAAALALLPAWMTAQQPAVITGTVTGEGGRPVANATVAIREMELGTTTREDGHYTLLVPAARVGGQSVQLTARAINYRPVTVAISLAAGQVTQDFALASNPLQLGEVVVTGAGTTSEVEKLGAVRDKISPDEIQKSNESSPLNALAAKAPNVEVVGSSGEPGSSAFITIRGPRTYSTSSQPIIVVDGLPVDFTSYSTSNFDRVDGEGPIIGTAEQTRLSDINPADIDNVEILKGPAASSIYGARAAAGAILITTKKGQGGATRYTLRSNLEVTQTNKDYPLQTSFAAGRFGVSGPFGIRSWGASTAGIPTFDHATELFENGLGSDNTLTISGGNDKTLFYLSSNYNYTNGYVIGNNDVFNRVNVRLNGSHRATDRLKITGNVSYSNTRGRYTQRGNNTSGILLGGLRTPPDFNNLPDTNVFGVQRSYTEPDNTAATDGRTFDNPFYSIEHFNNRSTNDRVFGNIGGDWNATDWLKFTETLGADYYNDERLEGQPLSAAANVQGAVLRGHVNNFIIDHNLTATATWKTGPNLGGTLTLGNNLNHKKQVIGGTTGRGLIAPDFFTLENTITRDPDLDQQFVDRVVGYFAQATFDIGQQLFLTGAIRRDGSSTYGRNNKYAWFPKASMAWNFIRSRPEGLLSYGKLRASYGEAGIEPQPYQLFDLVVPNGVSMFAPDGLQGTGLQATQNGVGGAWVNFLRGNPNLKEERSKEFEAGIDLGFLKDHGDLSFTWYNSKTTDVILLFPLAPSTGFTSEARNAGTFRNRGIEATLNLRPITKQNFGWDVGFQFARNRNIVLDIAGVDTSTFIPLNFTSISPTAGVQIGRPFGVLRGLGLVKCGIGPGGDPAAVPECAGAPTGAVFIRANGFPLLDQNQRIVADPNYDWTGSARTTFRLGKLQLSGLLDVRHGGNMYNGTRGALYSYGTHKDTEQRATCVQAGTVDDAGNFVPNASPFNVCGGGFTGNEKTFGTDFWFTGPVVGPGAGLAVPVGEQWYRQGPANVFNNNAEDFVETAGFVRLREVSVQFTVDQAWVRRTLGFSSIDLRVAGRNLLTSTDYTGLDPETNLGQGEQPVRGKDYFNLPQSRSFVFGITLNR